MKGADSHRGVCQAFVNKDRLEVRRIFESWILEIELYDLIFLKLVPLFVTDSIKH